MWAKARWLGLLVANANPNRKPLRDVKKLMKLPLIDDAMTDIVAANIERLLEAKAKGIDLRRKPGL